MEDWDSQDTLREIDEYVLKEEQKAYDRGVYSSAADKELKKEDSSFSEGQGKVIYAICSFFIPGIGQLLKLQIIKAIVIFLSVSLVPILISTQGVNMYGLNAETNSQWVFLLYIPSILIWLWQIIDAYQS